MNRRRFLIGSAASGAGLFVGYVRVGRAEAAGTYAPSIWYVIDRTGIVTVHILKAEVGQHIGTAFAMMIAEELAADWRDMRIDYPDPARQFGILVTAGSWSIAASYDDLRRYGAAGRIALIEAGAKQLGVGRDDCTAVRGWVIHRTSGRRVSYGALVGAGAVNRVFEEADLAAIALKPDGAPTVIGTSPPALDIPAKVNGSARFAIDCFAPNLLYTKIARPPLRAGCRPRSIDDTAARRIAGYRRFVSAPAPAGDNGYYVMALADNFPAARAAAKALDIDWESGPNGAVDDAAILARAKALVADPNAGTPWWIIGDADKAMTEAATVFSGEYATAHVAHAGIEPMSALVLRDGDIWHCYAGSAFQTHLVAALADALDTDSGSIALHQTEIGDPSGRRVEVDAAVACALAAKAADRPVKLIFDRAEAFGFDFPRPLTYQKLSAGLDRAGRITALTHDLCSAWPLARALPIALLPGADGKTKVDWSVLTGADSWYSPPAYHVRAIKNDLAQRAVPSGFLRGAATGFAFWALESFIDELAEYTGEDAVALRLRWLDGSGPNRGGPPAAEGGAARLATVIRKIVALTGYTAKHQAKNCGHGIGLAASSAPDRMRPSWTACVAEVDVDAATGAINVAKLTVVTDIGAAVHRDGALAQVESATLWGLSVALYEQALLVDGAFHDTNFNTYSCLRYDQVPPLDIHLVAEGQHPTGAGEPAMSVVAPALGNAIFNAIGARVRDLPITADKVRAAIKK
ncbi:MAG TPA: molybdopterin cofactor-binding domain-containing protein [Stellaceae bacterium]